MLLQGRREEEESMKIVTIVSRQEGVGGRSGTLISREMTGGKTERKTKRFQKCKRFKGESV